LLDDIFDKLDNTRVESLLKMVSSGTFGQVFISETSEERLKQMLEQIGRPYNIIHVNNGKI